MRALKYRTHYRAPHHGRGFTLIEVIVALIVVSLGMLAVIETVGGTARNTTYLRDKTVAHWVAMNKLTEVRLLPSAPGIDKSSDEIEMAGRKWRWTMEVEQTPVETIRRINIRVRPAEAPETSSMASVSGFYGTAVAPAGTTVVLWKGTPGGGGPGGRGTRGDQNGDDNEGKQPSPPNGTPNPDPQPNPTPELGEPVTDPNPDADS